MPDHQFVGTTLEPVNRVEIASFEGPDTSWAIAVIPDDDNESGDTVVAIDEQRDIKEVFADGVGRWMSYAASSDDVMAPKDDDRTDGGITTRLLVGGSPGV